MNTSLYFCEGLRMQKKWKWCLKKISVEKKSRKILKVKKWLHIHNKKYFTFEKIKENNNNNSNKKQTKNLTKVNDQFLSMVTLWLLIRTALEKCYFWLDEDRWRQKKWQELENRSQEEDTRFEWSRMKCSRSSNNAQDKWGEYTVQFIHGNFISVPNLQSMLQKTEFPPVQR